MIFPLILVLANWNAICSIFIFIALRALSCGLVSLLVYTFFITHKKILHTKDLSLFIQAGLFGIYLTFIPEFWALQYLYGWKSSLSFVLAPFYSTVCTYYGVRSFFMAKIIGLIIGLIGFMPVLISKSGAESSFTEFSHLIYLK